MVKELILLNYIRVHCHEISWLLYSRNQLKIVGTTEYTMDGYHSLGVN